MPNTYKVLGQLAPANTTAATLYTVPSATSTVVSAITVANVTSGGTTALYRIAIRPAGATLEPKHYIAFDVTISPNDTITLVLGITLAATDVITVRTSVADTIAFSAFGCEIT
jgi:hypothetical protein